MLALARFPNVAVKMSGAPSYSSQPYPYRHIHGYLRQIFEAFGPDRSFWGTDITRMPCSYRQCVTMFTEELPWLRGRELERVMGESHRRLARLEAARGLIAGPPLDRRAA
jgi:predicted TIM-barrel fold metal-dependent hydrolase